MKIIGAKVIVCSPGRNFVTLKVETDEGIYGLGDATLNGRELAVVSYLEDHLLPKRTTLKMLSFGAPNKNSFVERFFTFHKFRH